MQTRRSSTLNGADLSARVVEHASHHLQRLGYQPLEHHVNPHRGARLLVAQSTDRRELLFSELCVQSIAHHDDPGGALRRRRLRRAALAWLGAHPSIATGELRFDRLTVIVGHDGTPLGIEHVPNAF